jgi:hypothetical protein
VSRSRSRSGSGSGSGSGSRLEITPFDIERIKDDKKLMMIVNLHMKIFYAMLLLFIGLIDSPLLLRSCIQIKKYSSDGPLEALSLATSIVLIILLAVVQPLVLVTLLNRVSPIPQLRQKMDLMRLNPLIHAIKLDDLVCRHTRVVDKIKRSLQIATIVFIDVPVL